MICAYLFMSLVKQTKTELIHKLICERAMWEYVELNLENSKILALPYCLEKQKEARVKERELRKPYFAHIKFYL